MSTQEAVQVIIRCRPFNNSEKERGCKNVCTLDATARSVSLAKTDATAAEPPKMFTFDAVYGESSEQTSVYDTAARPIVEAALSGYNGTIFAYGQTGTGKTFTMQGVPTVPELRGIIPNAFHHIFQHIAHAPHVRFLVTCSFLEIYNEEVRDLMVTGKQQQQQQNVSLELKEHPETGVYVKDLSKHVCKSVAEMEQLMALGNGNRSVAATQMNAESSRSHSIFTIFIESCQDAAGTADSPAVAGAGATEQRIVAGKLHLVDLAGSERQSKTGAAGQRLKEAAKINLSLTALGNCISSLVDGKSTHIPYRDSKLTRLLQDSLGGNSKTVMIATISPADFNFDESLSTLRYANRAKSIKNKPKVNEDPKDAMLNQYQDEIKRLRQLLQQRNNGNNATNYNANVTKPRASSSQADSAAVNNNNNNNNKLQSLEDDEAKFREMAAQIEVQMRQLAESKQLATSERDKATQELQERKDRLARERQERLELDAKLKALESQMLVGGKDIGTRLEEQKQTYEQQQRILAETRAREQELKRALDKKQEAQAQLEETFGTLQEEVTVKSRKLKKLWAKLEELKNETSDLQDEFYREKEDYVEMIRDLTRELQLRERIIETFVPSAFVERVKQSIHYDDGRDAWVVGDGCDDRNVDDEAGWPSETSTHPLPHVRRPISLYGRWSMASRGGGDVRYRLEQLVEVPLYRTPPTTKEFNAPTPTPPRYPDDFETTPLTTPAKGAYPSTPSAKPITRRSLLASGEL